MVRNAVIEDTEEHLLRLKELKTLYSICNCSIAIDSAEDSMASDAIAAAAVKSHRIFVKVFGGATYTICSWRVTNDSSVELIKATIREHMGVSVSRQRLIYAGRQLQDGCTLGDYKVPPEATLYVCFQGV